MASEDVIAVECRALTHGQLADRRDALIGQAVAGAEVGSLERVFLGDPADPDTERQTPAAAVLR